MCWMVGLAGNGVTRGGRLVVRQEARQRGSSKILGSSKKIILDNPSVSFGSLLVLTLLNLFVLSLRPPSPPPHTLPLPAGARKSATTPLSLCSLPTPPAASTARVEEEVYLEEEEEEEEEEVVVVVGSP